MINNPNQGEIERPNYSLPSIVRHVQAGGLLDGGEINYLAGLIQIGLSNAEIPDQAMQAMHPPDRLIRRSIRTGQEARHALLEGNKRLAYSYARKIIPRGIVDEDMVVQDAIWGIWDATGKYTPDHPSGAAFSTFAYHDMQHRVFRNLAEHGEPGLRIPVHISDAIGTYKRVQKELTQALGREPEESEIAEVAGAQVMRYIDFRKVKSVISLDSGRGYGTSREFTDEEGQPRLKYDPTDTLTLDDEFTDYDRMLDVNAARDVMRVIMTDLGLDEREQAILDLRFGLSGNEPLTTDEIGKLANRTRERIRQLEIRAMEKVRLRLPRSEANAYFGQTDAEIDSFTAATLAKEAARRRTEERVKRPPLRQRPARREMAGQNMLGRVPESELSEDQKADLADLVQSYQVMGELLDHDYRDHIYYQNLLLGHVLLDAVRKHGGKMVGDLVELMPAPSPAERDVLQDEWVAKYREIAPGYQREYWYTYEIDPKSLEQRRELVDLIPDPYTRINTFYACLDYADQFGKPDLIFRLHQINKMSEEQARSAIS